MKHTTLIEFFDKNQNIIRGLLVSTGQLSDTVVVMAHRFENGGVGDKKFKILADELIKHDCASFRFDFAGCGISDGDFRLFTVEDRAHTLKRACDIGFKYGKKLVLVGHSLGCAVITEMLRLYPDMDVCNILFFAPSLHIGELLRYWYVRDTAPLNTKQTISWKNYKKHLNEDTFQSYINNSDRMIGSQHAPALFYAETQDKDYGLFLQNTDSIACIQGDSDTTVPIESISVKFKQFFTVKDGDHALEQPDMVHQWLQYAINYIVKRKK